MAHADAFLDELLRVSAELDRLIADRQSEAWPSPTRHEGHVDQSRGLAERLFDLGRRPGRPVHPPRGTTPLGLVW